MSAPVAELVERELTDVIRDEAASTRRWCTRKVGPLPEVDRFSLEASTQKSVSNGALPWVLITLALGLFVLYVRMYNISWFWYAPSVQLYSMLTSGVILTKAFLALFYKEPKDQNHWPTASVIVAVKNEQNNITETIRHTFASRYPADRFEVIVIDDGSTDNTWAVLQQLCSGYQNLRLYQFTKNMGKRHAMAFGAQKAQGEILIYIDSDCMVAPESMYKIVQPFADKRVGAVSGHLDVVIDQKNFISKMEAVRYYVSHRIFKAVESIFGAVTCCPGAFSAYRKEAVLYVLPEWLGQSFLGSRATFGDDRSLTNFILRNNMKVLYHAGARCLTWVPETWPQYFRQQLRWKKSWFRETYILAQFFFRKHPIAVLLFYPSILVSLCSPLLVFRNLIYGPLTSSGDGFSFLIGLAVVYLFFSSLFLLHKKSSQWVYGLAFAGLYVFVLSWQNYYAIATVSKTHWGTR